VMQIFEKFNDLESNMLLGGTNTLYYHWWKLYKDTSSYLCYTWSFCKGDPSRPVGSHRLARGYPKYIGKYTTSEQIGSTPGKGKSKENKSKDSLSSGHGYVLVAEETV